MLQSRDSWVVWRYEQRDDRWTKPPRRADGRGYAKSTDPETWASYRQAQVAAAREDGIGLVMVDDLVGIDLDHVIGDGGELEPWAVEVLRRFTGCYVERSPGGDGLRIFCRGAAPRSGKGGPGNRLEVYDKRSPRYLTVTGHRFGDDGEVIEAQGALDWLHAAYLQPKEPEYSPPRVQARGTLELADEELIRRACAAGNGAKFGALFAGVGGEDASSNDAALVAMLAFWTRDPDQIDRIFRRSGLMRDKWDEARGGSTYGAQTIERMLARGGETYSGPQVRSPATPSRAATPDRGVAWGDIDRIEEPRQAEPASFPFDALGPILGPAARAVHQDVQAPDALAAGSILAAASLAAQCHADVIMPHGQRAPLSLFILSAAESGERKSSCDTVVQREVEEIRKEQARQYQAELEAAQGDKEAEQPIARSLTIGKGTVEGIESILKRQSHVAVFSAEGGEVLGGHSLREDRRSAGLAWLLKAWGAETLDSLTRGSGLTVLLQRRVALHLMAQPVLLRGLLADPLASGQGLLARCLISQPRSLAGTRMFKPVNPNDRQELRDFHGRMRTLLRRPPPMFGGGDGYELNPRPLTMSDEARALWIEFYNAIEREQAPGGKLQHARAFASKAAEHAARIAGVVQLITDPDAADIGVEAMDCGMTLAEFYTSEHVRLTGAGAEERHYGVITGLLEWLVGRGPLVPHRDVLQRSPRPIRELKADGIARLLGELAERHYIRKSGDAWEVNPDA